MDTVPTPTIGEVLKEEFMKPSKLSIKQLADEIDLPPAKIQDILQNRCQITVDISVRLGRLFGVSDNYFLNLQNDINTRE